MDKTSNTELSGANAALEAEGSGPSILDRFHRHLHGRYRYAFTAGMLAALVGAYLGYKSARPIYRSTGVLRITPLTLKILYAQTDVASSIFEGFVDVQINSMRSRGVITTVLDSPEWKDTHPGPPMEPEAFLRNLEITHQPRSELIDVSFNDATPAGAQAGVKMLIDSYMKISGDQSTNQRITATQERNTQLSQQLESLTSRISEITQKYGTDDLKQLHQAKVLELGRLETMITDTNINLVLSEAALGKSDAFQSMPASEIATTDELMRRLLEESQRTEERLTELSLTRGKDHPEVVAVRTKLETLKREIAARMEAFHKFHRSSFVNNVGVLEGVPTPASVDMLKERREKLRELYNAALQKSLDIGAKAQETAGLLEEARKTRERLADNQSRVEQLRADAAIGLIMVVNTGDIPGAPAKDRRRLFALAGAMGAFGLGFSVIAALAFTDRRLRRVADFTAAGIDLPVIGTFPRSSPGLAAKAANALHEVITFLQLDSELSQIRVFAVSSASPLARKSDLAAALAFGFAALGKRVLLVDFDHRTRLLTQTWNRENPDRDPSVPKSGLGDVLAGAAVDACCQSTAVDKVKFLPLEGQETGHIGTLTSKRVHEFLAKAAAVFDEVILDTPPILEGLDAALICKETESLLLAATPACSDRDVTKAISALRTAGVVVGGILFCEVSASRSKSLDRGVGPELAAFRPAESGTYIAALFGATANIGQSQTDES